MLKKVVILGGSVTALGLIRAYAKIGIKPIVFYEERKNLITASKYTYKAIKICQPESNEAEYIQTLMDYGKKQKGTLLLVPTSDETVLISSKYKKKLSKYYIVSTPDYDNSKSYIEKENTYKLCEKLKIPHPKTFYPESNKELLKIIDKIPLPAIIKPRVSHRFVKDFNTKLFLVKTKKELKEKFSLVAKKDHQVVVQEYIEGKDEDLYGIYTYYNKEKKHVQSMCFHKIRCTPPRFGVVRIVKNIPMIPIFEKNIKKLFDYTGYTGMGFADFKFDKKDGKYKLIEVNPRFVLHCSLHTEAGLNYPLMVYKDLVENKAFIDTPSGETVYWCDIYSDLANLISGKDKREGWGMKDYFAPYFKRKTMAVFSLKDPLPFLKQITLIPFHIFSVIKRNLKKRLLDG